MLWIAWPQVAQKPRLLLVVQFPIETLERRLHRCKSAARRVNRLLHGLQLGSGLGRNGLRARRGQRVSSVPCDCAQLFERSALAFVWHNNLCDGSKRPVRKFEALLRTPSEEPVDDGGKPAAATEGGGVSEIGLALAPLGIGFGIGRQLGNGRRGIRGSRRRGFSPLP